MGIKTTYAISRDTAIKVIKNKIDSITNKQLEDILEGLEPKISFRNYNVHDKLLEDKGWFFIENVDGF